MRAQTFSPQFVLPIPIEAQADDQDEEVNEHAAFYAEK
jgi:hypothetical protein